MAVPRCDLVSTQGMAVALAPCSSGGLAPPRLRSRAPVSWAPSHATNARATSPSSSVLALMDSASPAGQGARAPVNVRLHRMPRPKVTRTANIGVGNAFGRPPHAAAARRTLPLPNRPTSPACIQICQLLSIPAGCIAVKPKTEEHFTTCKTPAVAPAQQLAAVQRGAPCRYMHLVPCCRHHTAAVRAGAAGALCRGHQPCQVVAACTSRGAGPAAACPLRLHRSRAAATAKRLLLWLGLPWRLLVPVLLRQQLLLLGLLLLLHVHGCLLGLQASGTGRRPLGRAVQRQRPLRERQPAESKPHSAQQGAAFDTSLLSLLYSLNLSIRESSHLVEGDEGKEPRQLIGRPRRRAARSQRLLHPARRARHTLRE